MLSPETTMGTDEKFDSSLVRISIDSMKIYNGQAFRRKPRACRGPKLHAQKVTDRPNVEAHLYAAGKILSKPFLSFFLKKFFGKYPLHIEGFFLWTHYIQKSYKINRLPTSSRGKGTVA
jgi:hypothetical protein